MDSSPTTPTAPAPAPGSAGDDPPGYPPSGRTDPTRARQRVSYDRALVHAVLDDGYLCHLGFVRDGAPVVVPTLYARVGERLYVHGSTGSRAVRDAGGAGGEGRPVCLTVTHVDGLVLAKSAFHHSVNYRCVMVHGLAHEVTDPAERATALDAIVDQVVPGRAADSRPGNRRELAATAVVRLDLREVSAKVRTGGPNDDPEDVGLPHWAGVVPVTPFYGAVVPSDRGPRVEAPAYLPSGAHSRARRTAGAAC
ncbi:pyridoxamine 5'-phosphate oxidase family protein [Actinacidiphila yeochonensis]|uniref:pyridoxamine 5'-phosphate oxidase family protein n=1 Tax=Actinacidiphila yeochonensis TaxID=89050 RepID=UPI00069238D6|nr:pyridoxamine 5'-phosphate oxidase family protein [Actinacidiphila yeochonensis]